MSRPKPNHSRRCRVFDNPPSLCTCKKFRYENNMHADFMLWLSSNEVREGIVKSIYSKEAEMIGNKFRHATPQELADAVIGYLTWEGGR